VETYESWVSSFVAGLADHFNLHGWTIRVKHKSEAAPEKALGGSETYAEIEVNSTYMYANLFLYPLGKKDFEAGEMDQLVMALVHELVHIFLDPFQEQMVPHLSNATSSAFMNILEQQTQKLTMVFLKTLPPDIIPPR
jgi:hypothetical protein